MRVDTSGNVGIGTTIPPQRFTAANVSITGGGPASSGSAADPNAVSRFQAGAVVMDFGVYAAGQMWIQNRAASNYALNFDLVLNPNGGNVGIGTSTPSQKLQVSGGMDATELYRQGAIATSIGVNQTWQTPARAVNTTYTNSTGRPIAVSIYVTMNDPILAQLLINGVTFAWQQAGGNSIRHSLFAIVPNGSTYALTETFGVLTAFGWYELR